MRNNVAIIKWFLMTDTLTKYRIVLCVIVHIIAFCVERFISFHEQL